MPVKEDFINHARLFVDLGFSVIPLEKNSKAPAVPWKGYQHRIIDDAGLDRWFGLFGYAGIAIVTGAISGLAVLDFDDRDLFAQFKDKHPDLAETFTVATRRGYHLYFRVETGSTLRSSNYEGLDCQVDGRYVVAPPTVIDKHRYAPLKQAKILTLDNAAERRIQAFLKRLRPETPDEGKKPVETLLEPSTALLEASHLIARYKTLAPGNGRNNALFWCACDARDSGWEEGDVVRVLAETHADQPANGEHRPERRDERLREAMRTIQSAFSRPPRSRPDFKPREQASYIPGSVREALLAQKMTAVLRVLEALNLAEVEPGSVLYREDLIEIARRHGVGEHSVRKTIRAKFGQDGEPVLPPHAEAPPTCTADAQRAGTASPYAGEDSPAKPTKNKRGRPKHAYRVPTIDELCERLGVEHTAADPILAEHIKQANHYRQALHWKLIERRPGQYSRELLSRRVGVSITTIRRYDRLCGVKSMPVFKKIALFWHNLRLYVPKDERDVPPGVFLQDEDGKRYPLKQALAAHLIKSGKRVYAMQQEANTYWVGAIQPMPPPEVRVERVRTPEMNDEALVAYWNDVLAQPIGKQTPQKPAQTPAATPKPQTQPVEYGVRVIPQHDPKFLARQRQRHDPDEVKRYWTEELKKRVNEAVAAVTDGTEDRRISTGTCKRLIEIGGVALAKQVLSVLDRRTNIEDPAAFVVSFMQSESRGVHNP